MNKKVIKRILGKRGTDLVRSVKDFHPKKLLIYKNGKYFTVDSSKLRSYKLWNRYMNGIWEPGTLKIFDKFIDKNHSYIDIGSNIGTTVLYGCQLAKHCFAIEPDPIAFQELKNNIELNDHLKSHITLSRYCISNSIGTAKLFPPTERLEYGGAGISSLIDFKGYKNFWEVQTTTIQQFIRSFSITDCNFIKIDIEGAEFDMIPSLSDYLKNQKPVVLIELHPALVKDPIKKLAIMFQTFDIYDHIYDTHLLKEIDRDDIINIDLSRGIVRVLLTDLAIPHF